MGVPGSAPPLPKPRGPVSRALFGLLHDPPAATPIPDALDPDDGLGDDTQIALYACYELHYRGFDGVDAAWEWAPQLLALRGRLEAAFLQALRGLLPTVPPLDEQLEALLVEPVRGTGPSWFLQERGQLWQMREYAMQRSLYHLKEADPQAWLVPRLHGSAQAAFLAILFDEYGDGHPGRVHSHLFAEMMTALGLDPSYGRYVDVAAPQALAVVNLMSLCGLHRHQRGALIGQFAAVEITSSPGSARLAQALTAMGVGDRGTAFYREHIEADAVHEQLVRHEVIDAAVRDEPDLAPQIAFGLAAGVTLDDRLAEHMTNCWSAGGSCLC